MDYKVLQTLPKDSIIDGIRHFAENSQSLYESATLLATQDKHGPAIALLVLSIEELTKGYAAFMYLMGVTDENTINAAFKPFRGKGIHETRLLYAAGIKQVFLIDFKFILEQIICKPEILGRIQNFQSEAELYAIINVIMGQIDLNSLGINDQFWADFEIQIAENEKWLSQAKSLRENGIYVDFRAGSWLSPQHLDVQAYDEALVHAAWFNQNINSILQEYLEENTMKRYIIELFVKIAIQRFRSINENDTTSDKQTNP